MKIESPNLDFSNYSLTPDAIKAVKILVKATVENIIKNLSLDDMILKNYHSKLDEYMMKKYPDLSNHLSTLSLNLNDSIKKFEKREKEFLIREKKVMVSESAYEDIYKLRDEVKELKALNEELLKKLKKAFS